MGMDPVQWVFLGIELVKQATIIKILLWLFQGGWKFVLRTIGFDLDTLLTSVIARVYEYFMDILSQDLFNELVITELMKNMYVFVGLIMFFRLLMLLIKYLVDPDLVGDKKIGVNALVQRVIIGLMGILFIPTIFDVALSLQKSILLDNLIQQIIIPKNMLSSVKAKQKDGGKYIGTYVLAGFISPGENASSKTKNEYESAIANGDLSSLSTLRKDGWLVGEYEYNYFYLLSTFCLCYVLFQMIKYTLDIITRYLRMMIYQILAPVAMIEYMINGSEDGVFKSWKNGILSTYFMLFVRVLAMWLVVFVTALMASGPNNAYVHGSLLAKDDYLLRAMIIIAVIGFMMDLPKIMGQIFGLDFEQEGHATGILKQVGGMVKGAAIGALAVGGAAVGGAIGTGKAIFGSTKTGKKWNQAKHDAAKKNPGLMSAMNANKAAMGGILGAAIGSNQITGTISKGYQGSAQKQQAVSDKAQSEANSEKEEQRHQEILRAHRDAADKTTYRDVIERIVDTEKKDTPKDVICAMSEKNCLNGKLADQWAANAGGDAKAGLAAKKPKTDSEAVRVVEETLVRTASQSGIKMDDIPAMAQDIVVSAQLKGSIGTSNFMDEAEILVTQRVKQAAQPQVQEITQMVNQIYGTRVTNAVDDINQTVTQKLEKVNTTVENATQTVTQKLETISDNTESIERNVKLTTDIAVNKDIREQDDLGPFMP